MRVHVECTNIGRLRIDTWRSVVAGHDNSERVGRHARGRRSSFPLLLVRVLALACLGLSLLAWLRPALFGPVGPLPATRVRYGVGIAGLLGFFALAGVATMLQRRDLQLRLLREGRQAVASIIQVSPTGRIVKGMSVVKFALHVQPIDGSKPFSSESVQAVAPTAIPVSGMLLPVRYDPKETSLVVAIGPAVFPQQGADGPDQRD